MSPLRLIQFALLILVALGMLIVARAALDTALAIPRIAAEAESRAAW